LSGPPQHAAAHLAIDAYRRAKVDDLNAASLDSDFHLAPGTSRGIVVGSKSDTLESGPAMAGTIESELVTVPGRSGFVIARWNRHIEAALARKEAAAAGAALKVPIRQGIRPFRVPSWAGAREAVGAVLMLPGPAGFLSCRSGVGRFSL